MLSEIRFYIPPKVQDKNKNEDEEDENESKNNEE